MSRPIKIDQAPPKERKVYDCIVPFGLYLNKAVREASVGDTIQFEGWKDTKFTLLHRRMIKVSSQEFSRLKTHLYGEKTSVEQLFERWSAEALVNGYGRNAFDKEQVLYLELEPIND